MANGESQQVSCPKHDLFEKQIEKNFLSGEKRMDQLEEKIDKLLSGQAEQALAIQSLHSTVSNGLRGEIRRTKECAESLEIAFTGVCKIYDEKFKEFDDFRWFRVWANKTKDGAIAKILTVTATGGFIIGMLIVLLWLAKHIGIIRIGAA